MHNLVNRLIICLNFFNFLDLISTVYCFLKFNDVIEYNIIIAYLYEHFNILTIIFYKLILIFLISLILIHLKNLEKYVIVFTSILTITLILCTINNYIIIFYHI